MDAVSYAQGAAAQAKVDEVDARTSNVDNTADLDKPISTLQQAGADGITGEVSMVASGALTNGDVVSLNTDGSVSVAAGISVDLGTEYLFSIGTGRLALSYNETENVIVIFYTDAGLSGQMVRAGTINSNGTVTWGTAIQVHEALLNSQGSISSSTNSNQFMVLYETSANTTMTAKLGTLTGNSISLGAATTMFSGEISGIIANYDSDTSKFITLFRNESDYGKIYSNVGTISSGTVLFNTAERVIDYALNVLSLVSLPASSTFLAASEHRVTVVDYSTGVPVEGPSYSILGGNSVPRSDNYIAANGNTAACVSYSGVSDKLFVTPLEITGSTVSEGTAVEISLTSCFDATVYWSPIDNLFILFYGHGVDGVIITRYFSIENSEIIWKSGDLVIDSNDDGTTYYTYASDPGIQRNVIFNRYQSNSRLFSFITNISTIPDVIGVSNETVADAQTAKIATMGEVVSNQTGLTMNSDYYVDTDGSLTTTDTGFKIGRALSTTELLIEGDR